MKKIMKFLPFLMTACVLGGVATATVGNISASATTESNKTLVVQSGYKSSFFGEVSNHKDKKGATVEFDLYDSDFKDINKYVNKNFDIMQSSGTFGSVAAISFTFGKTEGNYPDPEPNNAAIPAWHTYIKSERNFGGFQYFCNGEIKEWHNVGTSVRITDYIGYPSQFMEEGYSYKVMLRYDRFQFEGVTYNTDGNAWFCVERKGLFEDKEAYEILFAYKKKQTASYTDGTLAGMDIQGLSINANGTHGATSADGQGHSLHLELDNVRIYDGISYDKAPEDKRHWENFENVPEEALKTSDMTPGDATYVTYGDKNCYTYKSGIRQILVNFASAIGLSEEVTCRLKSTTHELYKLTFKDITTQETVGEQKTFTGFDFSSARIFKGEQVYQFDYSNIDYSAVKGDVEVFGTPVSYFTMRLYSGVGTIKDKVLHIGVRDKVLLDKNLFVRPGYNLVGFSTTEGSNTIRYEVGDIVDMKCQDMTLYAVWKLPEYKTTYKAGNVTLGEVITNVGQIPFYQGATPEKAGYVFAGWSKTAEEAQDQTILANFVQIADVNAENKAISVIDSITFKREGVLSASTVDICFDLIDWQQGAKIEFFGTDITNMLKDTEDNIIKGYKIRVTVSKQGTIMVSKAYMGTNLYEELGTATAVSKDNIEFTFANGVILDTLSISYDGQNMFTQTFEVCQDISTGILDNYYAIEGNAKVIACAKNIAVTFQDMEGRVVETTYTYVGGNVKLINSVEGISHNIDWNKNQNDLHNIQGNIIVIADLNWPICSISYIITPILGFMEVEGITLPSSDGFYGTEIQLRTVMYGNYAIIGWTDVANGSYAKYSCADKYVLKDESLTLYSVWGGKLLTVEFYAEDGTTLLETQTVETNATVRFGGKVPQKPGYKFVGWDKSIYNIQENTKFIAKYEKILKKVQVSVLGGTGAGRYTEGDVVTIAFRDIKGIDFVDWKVVSGNVTINEENGVYTFVVGAQDVVIEAVAANGSGATTQNQGCTSTVSVGIVAMALLCGCAYAVLKKKGEE